MAHLECLFGSEADYGVQQCLRYFVTISMSWNKARQECRSKGADLVIINSQEEQEFLSLTVPGEAWIGLSDSAEEGKWMWVDNTNMTTGFWWQGEPNDYEQKEDCAATGSKFAQDKITAWADYPCEKQFVLFHMQLKFEGVIVIH
ncbi:C-type lectin domain family 4 member E-like [Hemibagrus wyckioides]|uniref:C-type lectin domain family 4 member E-like n=1 Tax=Hemibagrus wyckioides TaxID=337641 RepID=UPI00266BC765|nr:C-type lectin domain family 4 member E-like [Hemibagrus wyckioides]